ncbi:hypothetical protein V6Z12_A11G185100 [Gossypium hirsutum]
MGNVNGREDGNNSPSGIEEEETRANSALEAMAAPMGHSPPHSPTSTHSPLMFTPQPNPIHVAWDNWKTRIPLQRCGKDFTIMKVLPSGVYQYRFIVDGQWRYAPDLPWAQDGTGNANNILDLQVNLLSLSWYGIRSFRISNYLFSLNTRDFAKEPPLVPLHVQLPLLNLPASYDSFESTGAIKASQLVINAIEILKQKLDVVRLSEDTVEADDQFGELGAHMQGG